MKAFINDIIHTFKPGPRVLSLQKLAKSNHWHFDARRKLNREPDHLLQFELFKGSRGKRLVGVMNFKTSATKGNFRIYDYVYFGDLSTKSTTVLEYTDSRLKLSPFNIRPKGSLSGVKEMFISSSKLILPTTPEFNQHYVINAQNHQAIKLDLNLNFLDEIGDVPDWTYEGQQDYLIAYQFGKLLPPSVIESELKRFIKMCTFLNS